MTLPKKGKEPFFTSAITNVTVALGREAVLTCSVADLDHFKVGWMRAEDQTVLTLHRRVVTHNSRISVSTDGDTVWRLHIRQVKESDRGCYMCQINTSTMSKRIGCIDVHVPPDIVDPGTSSDIAVDEGSNTTLHCRARGHPKPKIQWRREDNNFIPTTGDEVYYGDVLPLYNIDRGQAGAYLCIATNDVPPAVSKRISLNVNYPPELRLSHEVIGAPVGSDIRIFCYIKGYPIEHTYWSYRNYTVPRSVRDRVTREDTGVDTASMSITLFKLAEEDFGEYTCHCNNSLGATRISFMLYEIKTATTTTTTTTTTTNAPTTSTTRRPRSSKRPAVRTTPKIVHTTRHSLEEDYELNIDIDDYENQVEAKGVGARSSHISGESHLEINIKLLLSLVSCCVLCLIR